MAKILSQAGVSLADAYDVEGSIAGIDTLESKDVHLFHEMGGTLFSERLGESIQRRSTIALAASASWDIIISDIDVFPARIRSVGVYPDANRVDHANIAMHDVALGRDAPFWAWNSGIDSAATIRMQEDGAPAAARIELRPTSPIFFPTLLLGPEQPEAFSSLSFRGTTSAFGAGTVTVVAIIHLNFPLLRGVSTYGLPMPSW